MKFTQLEYFCAVSQCHSITKAAEQLFVTQPAVSSAIKELEKEFPVTLFTRANNKITLTKEGEIFYKKASNLLDMIHQTSTEFSELGQKLSTLKVGIPPLLSTVFFPELVLAFKREHPNIPIELYEYGSIKAASLVRDGTLDVAMCNMHFYNIDKLNSCKLFTDQIVFAVSKNHKFANEEELTADMLRNDRVILYNTDSVQNSTLGNFFKRTGVQPNVIMHASQLFTIDKFVREKLAGAFLYSSLLTNLPDLIGIPLAPRLLQDIGFVWPKGKYLNNSVQAFVDFIKNYDF